VTPTRTHLWAACAALTFTFPAGAQAPQRPRTELYGDPLPPGALARIGTVRWRHSDRITALAFTADGKHLVTGSADRTVRLWDVTTGKEVQRLDGHKGKVVAVAVSPDGRIASLGAEQALLLWDVAKGRPTRVVRSREKSLRCIAFAPGGGVLAVGGGKDDGGEGYLRVEEAATGQERPGFPEGGPTAWCLAHSPDGRLLAARHSRAVEIRDAATGALRGRWQDDDLYVDHWPVHWLAFAPGGRRLFTVTKQGELRTWDHVAGRHGVHCFETPDDRHLGEEKLTCFALSPDGKTLASGGSQGRVYLWDPAAPSRTLRPLRTWRACANGVPDPLNGFGQVNAVAFSPDGKVLAVAYRFEVQLFDTVTGRRLTKEVCHQGPIKDVAVSPDGATVATAGEDRTIRLWDPATGRERRRFAQDREWNRGVAFSPDGKELATTTYLKEVRFLDAATGRQVRVRGHRMDRYLWAVAAAPDGKVVAFGNSEGAIDLLDAASGKVLSNLQGPPGAVERLLFGPGGKLVSDAGGQFVLWDAAAGKEVRRFGRRLTLSGSIVLSPDGRWLAADQSDGIHLWDVRTGELAGRLPLAVTDGENVACLAFSPDGRTQAVAVDLTPGTQVGDENSQSYQARIHLWDVASRSRRGSFDGGHQATVRALSFAPDGRTLISGGADGTAVVWEVCGGAGSSAEPGLTK
jgi:WD40 repeat protein